MLKYAKWLLILSATLLSIATAAIGYLVVSETGLQWVGQISRTLIPGKLEWQSLNGNIINGPKIEALRYKNEQVSIRIEHFDVSWRLLTILSGQVSIEKLRASNIHINILSEHESESTGQTNDYDLSFMPSLPFMLSVSDAQIQGLSVKNLNNNLFSADTITLKASWTDKLIHIQHATLSADQYTLNASGALGLDNDSSSNLVAQWQINLPEYPPLAGQTKLAGTLKQLKITHSQTQPGNATVNGVLSNLLETPQLDLNIQWDDLVLQTLNPSYPSQFIGGNFNIIANLSTFTMNGELRSDFVQLPENRVTISGQGKYTKSEISVDSLMLDIPGIASHVNGHGNWRVQDNRFTLAVNWSSLQWPLVNAMKYESTSGFANLHGQLDDYSIVSEAKISGENTPPGNVTLSGYGSLENLVITDLQLETLGGLAEGQGKVTWLPQISWEAEVSGNDINPGSFFTDLPGRLNVKLASTGDVVDSRIQISAQLLHLKGQLRKIPLEAQGEIIYIDDEFQIPEFWLKSDEAQVNLSGTMSETWNLQWNLKAPNMATIVPGTQGNIVGNGTLSGNNEAPLLAGHLHGNTLLADKIEINQFVLDWQATLNKKFTYRAQLETKSVKLNQVQLDGININSTGTSKSHQLKLDGHGKDILVNIKIDGSLDNNDWHGKLLKADWTGPQVGSWKLKNTMKIRLAQNDIEISPSCWNSRNAYICVELTGNNKTGWDSKLSIKKLPFSMIQFLLPPSIKIEGDVAASMASKISPAGKFFGKASVELPPGHYFFGGAEKKTRYSYQGGKLHATMNKDGLQGNGQIMLQKDNGITLHWNLPQFEFSKKMEEQPFSLRVKSKLNDFSFIEATSLNAIQVAGEWQTEVELGGTLGTPTFDGHSKWQNGSIKLPDKGILLHQIEIDLDGSQRDKLILTGSVRSNKGMINLNGDVDLKPFKDWRASLNIKGENFEIIDIPESHILISPDLSVKVESHKVNIKGSLTIPEASLKPENLSTAVTSSKDVIIFDPNKEKKQGPQWEVSSEMRLLLGDKVWFDGFGLKAWLKGDLQLIDKPGEAVTGRGELGIEEGTFRAFGRPLKIDRGRLIFRGGSVDNPGLDVAASRTIDAESVRVSVKIGGTLSEPTFNTSSEPPMAQTDILSYLLYGKKSDDNTSISSELLIQAAASAGLAAGGLSNSIQSKLKLSEFSISGSSKEDMAMTLGSYLSPKLFVGYTFGLFESDTQFQLSYKLSKNWRLEMETSNEASGGDVFYSFER